MRIQHNIMAMNAYRNLGKNNGQLNKNLEKLSSGYRINRAGDDAAGLAISEKMRAQIAGLDQAQKNAQSGINLVQTAEGALTEVHDMLNRMVTLATQAANGTYDSSNREKIQAELTALTDEIDRIATNSNFNGKKLLDGTLDNAAKGEIQIGSSKLIASAGAAFEGTVEIVTDADADKAISVELADDTVSITLGTQAAATYSADKIAQLVRDMAKGEVTAAGDNASNEMKALMSFQLTGNDLSFAANDNLGGDVELEVSDDTSALVLQIGADGDETIQVAINAMGATALGIDALNLDDEEAANAAITTINEAIEKVSTTRGSLGAIQNRLEHTINNLGVMEENIQDAEANIRDTDIADEMMAYTKNNILIQSAQAMLAQANQVPQGVLQLMQ